MNQEQTTTEMKPETTEQRPLAADDLVVGEEYEVETGWGVGNAEWERLTFAGKDLPGERFLFSGLVVLREEIHDHVRRIPKPPAPALTFGDPPAGHKWHNPENLTPEQVEVDKGWRLCLEDETSNIDHQVFGGGQWINATYAGCTFEGTLYTYRTKAPLLGGVEPPKSGAPAISGSWLHQEIAIPCVDNAYRFGIATGDYTSETIPDYVCAEIVKAALHWCTNNMGNRTLKALQFELEAARAELARLSWRPVSEKPEEGDGDSDKCVIRLIKRPDGSHSVSWGTIEAWPWPGCSYTVVSWKPADCPPPATPQPDPAYLRWKDEVSAEDKEAALFAGWKALQEGGAV